MEHVINIVERGAIPSIHEVTQGSDVHILGELRDFRWSESLRAFMPDASEFSVSWVGLSEGEVLQSHVHPIQSLMVIYSGRGEVIGDLCRTLSAGDIVVVPAGCVHGFVGGVGGLHALSIQFGEGLYTNPDNARVIFVDSGHSFDGLLAYNKARLDEFTRDPMFDLLAERRTASAEWRAAYLSSLESLLDATQVLVARQASCRDLQLEPEFRRHLRSCLLAARSRPGAAADQGSAAAPRRDPVIRALADWFTYQMYVLDNVEKIAIVDLVLEPAGIACRTRVAAILGDDCPWPLRDQNGDDERTQSQGLNFPRHQTLETYRRLEEVTCEAWDTLRALAKRIVELGRATR